MNSFAEFGNVFSTIGVHELQPRASEVFTKFGDIHRQMERYGIEMIKQLKPVCNLSVLHILNQLFQQQFIRTISFHSFDCSLTQVLSDLGTFLHKAIPDTRMTIGRYADAKFEYLSYCLKVSISFHRIAFAWIKIVPNHQWNLLDQQWHQ